MGVPPRPTRRRRLERRTKRAARWSTSDGHCQWRLANVCLDLLVDPLVGAQSHVVEAGGGAVNGSGEGDATRRVGDAVAGRAPGGMAGRAGRRSESEDWPGRGTGPARPEAVGQGGTAARASAVGRTVQKGAPSGNASRPAGADETAAHIDDVLYPGRTHPHRPAHPVTTRRTACRRSRNPSRSMSPSGPRTTRGHGSGRPQFRDGVERIEQHMGTLTHWVRKIVGAEREFRRGDPRADP